MSADKSQPERDPRKLIGRRMVVELTSGTVFEDWPAEVAPSAEYVRFERAGWMRADHVLKFELLPMAPFPKSAPAEPVEKPRRRKKGENACC